ncbi:hypothetical protein DRV84_14725 [Rhodosalinus sediminis]|uniref:Uncharacterized protein n=1 Tax=Rhodosalinus sediminis TaxID=1940533 RepID=A0A3D9BJS6_9RHOB|nr:hypothetical protein DRV84_14725 [Rhodosalinus sediminis]
MATKFWMIGRFYVLTNLCTTHELVVRHHLLDESFIDNHQIRICLNWVPRQAQIAVDANAYNIRTRFRRLPNLRVRKLLDVATTVVVNAPIAVVRPTRIAEDAKASLLKAPNILGALAQSLDVITAWRSWFYVD